MFSPMLPLLLLLQSEWEGNRRKTVVSCFSSHLRYFEEKLLWISSNIPSNTLVPKVSLGLGSFINQRGPAFWQNQEGDWAECGFFPSSGVNLRREKWESLGLSISTWLSSRLVVLAWVCSHAIYHFRRMWQVSRMNFAALPLPCALHSFQIQSGCCSLEAFAFEVAS